MSLTSRIVQGTAAVLLTRGVIKVVSKGFGQAKSKVQETVTPNAPAGPVAGEEIEISSGWRGLSFSRVEELPSRITMGNGNLTLDLAGLPVTADAQLALEMGTGNLKLKLPGNQNWVVAWSLGRGTFVAGRERRVGATLVGCNSHTALPDGPTLRLTVAQKNGLLNLTK